MENEGIRIPSVVRWLGRAADVKAGYNDERKIQVTSAIFAILGEAGFNCGPRHLGCRYDARSKT